MGQKYQLATDYYKNLVKYDPILKLLIRVGKGNTLWIYLFAIFVYSIFYIGLGIAVSNHYSNKGYELLRIYDPNEFPIAIFTGLIIAPILWGFYFYQIQSISKVMNSLLKNSVIGKAKKGQNINTFFEVYFVSQYNKRIYLPICLVIVIVSILIWVPNVGSSTNFFLFGNSYHWLQINPIIFWGVFIPIIYINQYMISWVVIRTIISVFIFKNLFANFSIRPRPYHPDNANGLAEIGNYSIQLVFLVIVFGFFITFWAIFPVFYGSTVFLQLDIVLMMIAYIILVPTVLIPPTWFTHLAMADKKKSRLERISIQLEKLLQKEKGNIQSNLEEINQFETKYQIIDKEYKSWPFSLPAIRNVSFTATLPIITTILPILIEMLLLNR